MSFKSFLLSRIQIYFLLAALIFAVSMIMGMIFAPDEKIYYYQLAGPFILSGLCILPTFVSYYKKEPTLKQYIIRNIIQLIMIDGIVIWMTKAPEDADPVLFYILISSAVVVIYFLVLLMCWLQKYRQSKKLTQQLLSLQARE